MTPRPETPRGIGGSPLIFFISCAVAAIVAIRDVVSVWQAHVYFEQKFHHSLSFDFIGFGWLLSGSRVLAPVAVIVLMVLVRRRLVVAVAIAALWLAFVALPALNILRMLTEPFPLPGWMPLVLWPLGFGSAFCVAATVYLVTSARVATTFARRVDVVGVFD